MFLKKYNLKNKTALVTGAGKGLGKACAIALAEAGANLIIISRTQKDLNQVSKIIKKFRVKCKSCVCDVTDYDQIKSQGSRTILLDFQGQLSTSDKEYIKFGEDQKLHERYLLSKRTPWYSMEQRKIAPIWAAVFGRKNLRFIYNQAKVYNLTTFHGFYPFIIDEEFSRALLKALTWGM